MAILNFKLLIEYDGSAFNGWQSQPSDRTVQAELEAALQRVVGGERVVVNGAGRTDSGVHARGQVASIQLETSLTPKQLCAAINAQLADDVRVQALSPAGDDFHARFSAAGRRYSYSLTTGHPVVGRQYIWQVRYPLDPDLLQDCAGLVMGRHDFEGFAKARPEQDSTDCNVTLSQWEQQPQRLEYQVAADRFLHHMVRFLVGSMVEVARGRFTLDQFARQLHRRSGGLKPYRAPAQGLVLEEVRYDRRQGTDNGVVAKERAAWG